MSTPTWRVARSLLALRAEVDAEFPDRDRASDGFVGDAAHATRTSDHNPWVKLNRIGIVRAFDCDKDVGRAGWADRYAERIRLLGAAGDRRLNPAGYVIWNKRIASAGNGWRWRTYGGKNPHEHHVHVSVSTLAEGFDDPAPWGVAGEDDMSAQAERQIAEIHDELFKRHKNRTGDPTATGVDTAAGFAINADGYGYRIERLLSSPEFRRTLAETVVDALLAREVGPVVTLRKGTRSEERVRVEQLLTRAAEGSVVRQVVDELLARLQTNPTAAAVVKSVGGVV